MSQVYFVFVFVFVFFVMHSSAEVTQYACFELNFKLNFNFVNLEEEPRIRIPRTHSRMGVIPTCAQVHAMEEYLLSVGGAVEEGTTVQVSLDTHAVLSDCIGSDD